MKFAKETVHLKSLFGDAGMENGAEIFADRPGKSRI